MDTPPVLLAAFAEISPDGKLSCADGDAVSGFCNRHGLQALLDQAVCLARECFAKVQALEVLVREDYEKNDEWLSLRIAVGGSIEEALTSYERYVQRWVESVP